MSEIQNIREHSFEQFHWLIASRWRFESRESRKNWCGSSLSAPISSVRDRITWLGNDSARKSDGSSARKSDGSSGGSHRRSGRRDGRGGLDHDSKAFEEAFKDVVSPEEIAKADASRIWGPELFDSGDGLQGFVHGPNLCASKDHCRFPRMDISKSTHKCSGCNKPIHSSICAKWCVEGGRMWCVCCKKPSPEPLDLMNNTDQPDCSGDGLRCQTIN